MKLGIISAFFLSLLLVLLLTVPFRSLHASGTGIAAPGSFFGNHFKGPQSVTPLPYGRCRIWGVRGAFWPEIEPSPGVYNFATLDATLAAVKNAGVNDGCIFTFGLFPTWASSNPSDDTCEALAGTTGSCWPPGDLNFDGSGTDQTVVDAISKIAAHVNNPTYLQTHAHIKYWEPFNEPYRSSTISGTVCLTTHRCSFNGSYAQLVRIAEDMRCVIKGKGLVNGVPCSKTALDPTAMIMTPSGQVYFQVNGQLVVANFLQCNQSPRPGSGCTTGARGSAAVDVVNFHCYVWSGNADDVVGYIQASRALLVPVDAVKPFFCDEGSWATNDTIPDPDLQAAFVPRWFLGILSQGVSAAMWYSWDDQFWGTFWNPYGKNGCTQTSGCLTPAGLAYKQTHYWLAGAILQSCQTANGTTTCTITRPTSYVAIIVWTTAPLSDCTTEVSKQVCGSTLYSVPAGYLHKRDLAGNWQPARSVEYIGAKPILFENR